MIDEQGFRTLFELAADAIFVLDMDGYIKEVNRTAHDRLGYASADMVGMHIGTFILPEFADLLGSRFNSVRKEGFLIYESAQIRKDGSVLPVEVCTREVELDGQKVIFSIVRDITERKVAESEIEQLAYYDPLTQLPNRRLLLDRLKQAVVSCTRNGRKGALMFIDMDNFKNLNDTLGHDTGDLMLQQVTQRLESCIRRGDTVARLGGDEFVVMLPELSWLPIEAAAQTEAIGEKILAALSEPYQLGTHIYHCTASIGVTLFSDPQQTTDELMKQADISMYQAKKAGRNTLRFFDQEMQQNISARVSMEAELRNAIEFRQLILYYQIQVDNSLRPLGAEALLRWVHPNRGLVYPGQFIPLAEETGLILPIGLWVLDRACAQIKAWEQDDRTRGLTVAVNVSARQFRQTDFVDQVQAAVQRHSIDPRLLKLELTESLLQENIEQTIATMNALNEFGVQFSLDDFGTGYSSLSYLQRFPFDTIKIDQSFVRTTAKGTRPVILRSMIALAHDLGMEVVAEGAETDSDAVELSQLGCEYAQGFVFGEPMAPERARTLLQPERKPKVKAPVSEVR